MAICLEWLGHCCFRLRSENGTTILIDPFDESIGYQVPLYKCDILAITHTHYDSAAIDLVEKPYLIVDTKGTTLAADIAFNCLPWWHDGRQGKDYGSVLIVLFELDGFKIGYLSHIGSVPQSWLIDKLKGLDICFIPVGGTVALGPSDARFLIKEISPKWVIPMHFDATCLNFTLLPVTEFLKVSTDYKKVEDWRIWLNREELPEEPTVLMLQHWPGVSVI
jgi:L-ascorbate metabolism protein UlaG (beta-lactamase superfamily)